MTSQLLPRVSLNNAESEIADLMEKRGWKLHRGGWPDFLCEKDGAVMALEVKASSDTLSRRQKRIFKVLESIGIEVCVIEPDWLKPLNWKDFLKYRRKLKERRKPFTRWTSSGHPQTKRLRQQVINQMNSRTYKTEKVTAGSINSTFS